MMAPWGHSKGKIKVQEVVGESEGSSTTIDLAVVAASDQGLDQTSKPSVFHIDPTEGEYQLKILHDPADAVVDIIFVHGLTGNRETTWTRNAGKQNACFWPKDILPDADHGIPNARIATWGYDADVINKRPFKVVSNNTIEQHAANLCTDLANARDGHKMARPLIFAVHSLGGLVVKTALLHANESRTQSTAHLSAVADSTQGVLFMGTPHRGSEPAQWGGILASVLGYVKQDNAELVRRLNKEEPRLAFLQERFSRFLDMRKETQRPVNVTCFFEELPVAVLGMIVPTLSAQMDPYPAIGIHANHMDMTKFGGDDSAGYIKVFGEFRRFVDSAKRVGTMETQPTTKHSTNAPATPVVHQHGNVHHSGNIAEGGVALYGSQTISGSHIGGVHHSHSSNPGAGRAV